MFFIETGVATDQKMMAVGVGSGAGFDVSKDGHFLLPTRLDQSFAASITVGVNWTAALNK